MDAFNFSATEEITNASDSTAAATPNWWIFVFQLSIALLSIPLEVLILLLIKMQFIHRPDLVLIVGFTIGNLLISTGLICSSSYRFGQREMFDPGATLSAGECFVKHLHGPIIRLGQDFLVINILLLAIDRMAAFAFAHRPRMFKLTLFLRLELLCAVVAACDMFGMFITVMHRAHEPVSSLCFLSQILGSSYMTLLTCINVSMGGVTIVCYMFTFALWFRQRRQVVGKGSALTSLQFRRESTVMRGLIVVFILTMFIHFVPWVASPLTDSSSVASKVIICLNLISKPLSSIAYITVHPHLRRQCGMVALSFKWIRNVKEWIIRRKTYIVYLGVK